MKFKVSIVEDEPLSKAFLERYCENMDCLELTGSYSDSKSALKHLQNNLIDILLLDVEMPDFTGFQLLDQVPYMPKVILTTSKTEYAFDAFQYGVVDFLKKPITYPRFQEAINKVKDSVTANNNSPENNQDEIFIKADGKLTRLAFQEILYIESLGDYVKYITSTKNYLTLCTLKSVQEKIDNRKFMKVHRSYIVNIQKIKDIQDNSLVIDGKVVPISKSHRSEVMSRINIV
jgi:DNA-binding LytR/AlgR family response regulator